MGYGGGGDPTVAPRLAAMETLGATFTSMNVADRLALIEAFDAATTAAMSGKAAQSGLDSANSAISALQTAMARMDLLVQTVTPTTGSTATSDGKPVMALMHTGLIAALTVVFPSTPRDGQQFTIASRSVVTALTLSAANTILGAVSTIGIAGWARWVYSTNASAWVRVG